MTDFGSSDEQQQPGPWLRLVANWGLALSEAGCLPPAEEPRVCPLRPLLERLQAGSRDATGVRRGPG